MFLSHNAADKEYVRPLAAAMQLTGAHVWFDEWIIRPGDSIPNAISEGLSTFGIFALVWSHNAANSAWVHREMNAAVARWLADKSCRLVPVRLDNAPLPALLSDLQYVDAAGASHQRVAQKLLDIDSDRAYRRALQQFLMEAELDFREFWGVGVMVACPNCGASADKLQGWECIDEQRDDIYRGAKCMECGWNDGSEV